jgi:hypothetical protein
VRLLPVGERCGRISVEGSFLVDLSPRYARKSGDGDSWHDLMLPFSGTEEDTLP